MSFGAIGSAISSAAGDMFGTWYNNRQADYRQHEAQGFEEMMFQNRYQNTVNDLNKAGLNPMLAVTNGVGGVPGSSAAGAASSNMGSSAVAAYNATKSTSAMVANTNADTMKKMAEQKNVEQDTLLKGGMLSEVAARTAEALGSAQKMAVERDKIRAEIPEVQARIDELESRVEKNKSDVELNKSLMHANLYLNSLRMAEQALASEKATAQNYANVKEKPKAQTYKDVPEYGDFMGAASWVGDLWRSLNPFRK